MLSSNQEFSQLSIYLKIHSSNQHSSNHALIYPCMHSCIHPCMHSCIHPCISPFTRVFMHVPFHYHIPKRTQRLETIEKALKTRLLIWLLRISEAIDLSQLFLFDRRRPVTSSATLPLLTYFCLSPFMFHNLVTFLSQTFFLFFYNFLSLIFSFFEFFSLFSCGI